MLLYSRRLDRLRRVALGPILGGPGSLIPSVWSMLMRLRRSPMPRELGEDLTTHSSQGANGGCSKE